MKSTISLLTAGVALGFGFALASPSQAGESVYSVNVVGFQQVELDGPSKMFMVSTPFESGNQALLDIFGTNSLVQSGTPAGADRISYWDTAEQEYFSVAQFNGQFFRLDEAGNYILPPLEDNAIIPIGRGFWISTSGSVVGERSITLAGDVIMDEEVEINIVAGLQILSVPFSAGLGLQDLAFVSSGATAGATPGGADQVLLWDAQEQEYVTYALFSNDNKWYRLDPSGGWALPPQESEHQFQPGEGFWYFARNPFTWAEESPYAEALSE